jgi:hypothetical protein
MRWRGSFPRIVAVGLILTLVIGILLAVGAGGDQPAAIPTIALRPDPVTGPFEGLGVWVDVYDHEAWADPGAAVADMEARGVRTLYLQTSNDHRRQAFVFPDGVAAFVDAAAAAGIQVVAWYLPGLRDVPLDRRRALAAIRYRTAAGHTFAGFALDIESDEVRDAGSRSTRLARLSADLRAQAGPDYPLGAIVPSPVRLSEDDAYWPDFPWAAIGATYDAVLPMTYFTWRAHGPAATTSYVDACVDLIRQAFGSDRVPIHVIGGIAADASDAETRAFVNAVASRGVLGASYYTWPDITTGQWAQLGHVSSAS